MSGYIRRGSLLNPILFEHHVAEIVAQYLYPSFRFETGGREGHELKMHGSSFETPRAANKQHRTSRRYIDISLARSFRPRCNMADEITAPLSRPGEARQGEARHSKVRSPSYVLVIILFRRIIVPRYRKYIGATSARVRERAESARTFENILESLSRSFSLSRAAREECSASVFANHQSGRRISPFPAPSSILLLPVRSSTSWRIAEGDPSILRPAPPPIPSPRLSRARHSRFREWSRRFCRASRKRRRTPPYKMAIAVTASRAAFFLLVSRRCRR